METVLTVIASVAISAPLTIGVILFWLNARLPERDPAAPASSVLPLPARPPGRRVRIVDLVMPGMPMISSQTFEGQHFIGPAFVKFTDYNRIEFCAVPDRRAILPMAEGASINGAVLISNCTFRRCYFESISIIGTMEDIEQIGPGFDAMPVGRWEALGHAVAGVS